VRQGAVTPPLLNRAEGKSRRRKKKKKRARREKKTRKRAREKENGRDRGMLCGSPALQGPSFVRNEALSQCSPFFSYKVAKVCFSKQSIGL